MDRSCACVFDAFPFPVIYPHFLISGYNPPDYLATFLDTMHWIASVLTDVCTIQIQFRAGIAVEDYQCDIWAREKSNTAYTPYASPFPTEVQIPQQRER
jgi:hypothetical protein